jgi:hypothetical protein
MSTRLWQKKLGDVHAYINHRKQILNGLIKHLQMKPTSDSQRFDKVFITFHGFASLVSIQGRVIIYITTACITIIVLIL